MRLKKLNTRQWLTPTSGGIEDLRYVICQAFDAIIFQERRNDGTRVISKIAELEYRDGAINLNVLN